MAIENGADEASGLLTSIGLINGAFLPLILSTIEYLKVTARSSSMGITAT